MAQFELTVIFVVLVDCFTYYSVVTVCGRRVAM